jgi:PAS domain S-box-containing protein
MLINRISGFIISLLSMATFALIALAVAQGWHTYDFDITTYFYSSKNWLAFLLSTALFIGATLYVYGRLESYLVQYIKKITYQSRKLASSRTRLEKEILERKLTENQLKHSEHKFKKVFNSIGDGILLLRPDNTVLTVNDSFLELTGSTLGSVLDKPLESFFNDPYRIKLMMNPGTVVTSLFNLNEHWLKKGADHGILPVEVRIVPIKQEKEIGSIIVIKDITRIKETEIKIMHAVINSEEEERKRIAEDLHDSIGPYLSAAKLYVNSDTLSENKPGGTEIRKELSDLLNLAISTIREISSNLGSHVLRTAGFHAALQNFIEKIKVSSNIKFDLQIPVTSPFIEKVEISLFRILVELINNSVKYSSATEIIIKQSEIDPAVIIEYLENGVGFRVTEVLDQHKGMGLYNILSRVNSLGGLVEYNSSPGNGVQVRITFNQDQTYKKYASK